MCRGMIQPLNTRQTYSIRYHDIKPIQSIYGFFDNPFTVFASCHILDSTSNHPDQSGSGVRNTYSLNQDRPDTIVFLYVLGYLLRAFFTSIIMDRDVTLFRSELFYYASA